MGDEGGGGKLVSGSPISFSYLPLISNYEIWLQVRVSDD